MTARTIYNWIKSLLITSVVQSYNKSHQTGAAREDDYVGNVSRVYQWLSWRRLCFSTILE
jgi:hypothetical protein